jgi:hypothetical protein
MIIILWLKKRSIQRHKRRYFTRNIRRFPLLVYTESKVRGCSGEYSGRLLVGFAAGRSKGLFGNLLPVKRAGLKPARMEQ